MTRTPSFFSGARRKQRGALDLQSVRWAVVKGAHEVYRRSLKGTPLGMAIARWALRRGVISREEVYLANASIGVFPVADQAPGGGVGYVPPQGLLPWFDPLHVVARDHLVLRPRINVLVPSLQMAKMSGGPNTALILAALLARDGMPVRLFSTNTPLDDDVAPLRAHIARLTGFEVPPEAMQIVDASDREEAVEIGPDDLFLATAWWTAQMAKYAARHTRSDTFLYLVQDYEALLHAASTSQALALETYDLPHVPIVNTRLLLDHLAGERIGRFGDPRFASRALVFEPAIDRTKFFPETTVHAPGARRTMLFYARPRNGARNLFEIGVAALQKLVADGTLDPARWTIHGMGEKFPPVPLGRGAMLTALPWLGFDEYARQMRSADLLLSLMLSPHPSYPPLEAAAAGRYVVTNVFSVKTVERLADVSPNILAAAPSVEGVADALARAIRDIEAGHRAADPAGAVTLPGNWNESLAGILPELAAVIRSLREAPDRGARPVAPGLPAEPRTDQERFRRARLQVRRARRPAVQEPGLLSFITTVWNTAPAFLEALAATVFTQDGGAHFEWLILDNGSADPGTIETLALIARHSCVRLERVEKNLGIIGGMRHVLEGARGRYVLPLDSDDLLEPDCVSEVTRALQEAGYPPLLYTDEDKLSGGTYVDAYHKPDWDPVLFLNSCYIAHLCAIDRARALELGAYTDTSAEGCHDWDTFIRFMTVGHRPVHVPEVLYTWRMHEQSTAGNIASKPYVYESHRKVLGRFLAAHPERDRFELTTSPLFAGTPDWWFRRRREAPLGILTVDLTGNASGAVADAALAQIPHRTVALAADADVHALREALASVDPECVLVHFRWPGLRPEGDEWPWEAMGQLQLFPDAMAVGGMLHDGRAVVDGGRILGFGAAVDCPDAGRAIADPGFFAQMWKTRTVGACSAAHLVVRRGFLRDVLDDMHVHGARLPLLGVWAGALAGERGLRTIFSPIMRATGARSPEQAADAVDLADFRARFAARLPEGALLSPRLGLTRETAYAPVSDGTRDAQVRAMLGATVPYRTWLDRALVRRRERYPLPASAPTFSILTTVYERTDFPLLADVAATVTGQTLRPHQWIIVAHGPLSAPLRASLASHAEAWRATMVFVEEPLGIAGAMRRALAVATGDYLIPLDADDLLTPDALQIMAHTIATRDAPDLVYSDEDLLVEGKPTAPYLRPAWDPVLNLDSSYVWHLCTIKRSSAAAAGLYADDGATWCHDWDTMLRIARIGGRIEHVREILYHWRQHAGSTTNRPQGSSRSLESVRHVLEAEIARNPHPERFAVEPWPVDRGAPELYAARVGPLPEVARIGARADDAAAPFVVWLADEVALPGEDPVREAVRLFDLHPRLGAAGGRVVDAQGRIVESCMVVDRTGMVRDPLAGRDRTDGGPYALGLKPHCVHRTGERLAFFRTAALVDCGVPLPDEAAACTPDWIASTCAKLRARGWLVASSPRIEGRFAGKVLQRPIGAARPVEVLPGEWHALAAYGAARPFDLG